MKLISEAGFCFVFILSWLQHSPECSLVICRWKDFLPSIQTKLRWKLCVLNSHWEWEVTRHTSKITACNFQCLKESKMDFYMHFMRWMCKKSSSSICVIRTITRSHDKHLTQKRELVKYWSSINNYRASVQLIYIKTKIYCKCWYSD